LTEGVAANVRRLRDARGWSVRQVAERCALVGRDDMTRSLLANVENGRRPYITLDELDTLANVFNVAASTLLPRPTRAQFCGQDIIDEQFELIEVISDHARTLIDSPSPERTREALRRLVDAMDRLRTVRMSWLASAEERDTREAP
jgi:transcriptional regulator with XRE-family HTH domain